MKYMPVNMYIKLISRIFSVLVQMVYLMSNQQTECTFNNNCKEMRYYML